MSRMRFAKIVIHPAFIALVVLLMAALVGTVYCGSPRNFMLQLRGIDCYATNPTIELGAVPKESVQNIAIVLRNTSNKDVAVIGCRKSCGCLVGNVDLPKSISRHGSLNLELQFDSTGREAGSLIEESLVFLINSQQVPVNVRIYGRVN